MRGFGIDIRGINRKVGSSNNDVGFCSELINLKQDNGVKVVPQKRVVSANIPYRNVSLHRIGKKINYIGIKDDATGVSAVHFDPTTGDEIFTFETFPAGSEVYYTTLNNQVVISNKTAIKEYVYEYVGSNYKLAYDGLDFPISIEPDFEFTSSNHTVNLYASSKQEYISALQAYVNQFKVEHKEYCDGAFLYAFTVTLKDGAETGMFNLTPVNTQWKESPSDEGSFISLTAAVIKPDAEGKPIVTNFKFNNFYQKIKLTIGQASKNILDRYSGKILKVNLYASRPVSKFVFNEDIEFVEKDSNWDKNEFKFNAKFDAVMLKDSGVEKELLYRQKSWSFEEFAKGLDYTFEFGGDIQTTGATMEVYATNIDRAGKMYPYNNKVHFYDTTVRLKPVLGDIYDRGSTDHVFADAYVYINTGNKDNVLKYEDVKIGVTSGQVLLFPKLNLPMLVFPDSRAYKIMFVYKDNSIEGYSNKMQTISLTPSPAYNYAYYFSGEKTAEGTVPFNGELPALSDTYEETDVINVSANGNPMVFPVSYSYKFKGNISSISVATNAISDTQVGQYPLTVFTDNGIFALEQGNGEVLYSNIVPISNDVCVNDSILPIRGGIAYIAHNSLWVLSGRKATKMSELLEGNIDTYIQNNTSFAKCCGGSLYDIIPYLSTVNFRTYVADAVLSWCPTTNELIVSNEAYNYSYVYDFINNSWYKVAGTFTMVEDNMVLQPVSVNTSSATPSKGTVTLSAIHSEKSRSFASICSANFDQSLSCSPGNTMALIIDGTQVASATFSQLTRMNMIVATLCEKVSYLEDTKGVIYSRTELSGKNVKIHNITTNTTMVSSTFNSSVQTVSIPNKAIGATISVKINNDTYSTLFEDASTVVTALNDLAAKINATSTVVTAAVVGNKISLTSKDTGSLTNNITISSYSNDEDYIYISTNASTMTGGSDISLVPSEYRQIVDWVDETTGSEQTIHLHTRPLHLGDNNTYKTIKRTALNCLADLKGNQNLSLYIYASDNLTTWKCVCAAQRKEVSVSQIIADRSAKAYKYFVFMIGGTVPDTTQIHNIITTVEDIADKKLR